MKKTLVVTGASRGIGAATARLAAGRGWAVAVVHRDSCPEAEAVAGGIRAAGGEALAFRADMAREADIVALFEAVDAGMPPLGGLVNNAARVAPRRTPVAELSAAEIDALLAVNVTGAIVASREAAARLSTARGGAGGAIVNVSSLAARHGAPRLYVHYAASKAALDAFTHGFAIEIAGEGIRVNAVRPGLIDTEIHARAAMPDRVSKVGPRIPIGRAGSPEEVARAILWLASDEASYVTGAILDVGGGG